jgi:hypothetical protein
LNLDVNVVYISQSRNLCDLKDKISSFEKVKNLYSDSLTKENLRLWKINPTATQQDIYRTITEIQSSDKNTISVDFLTYLECIFILT